eukprot:TRINITY_DN1083_c0_g2_i3.p1 TRINITY_DN1083_c0_g2~~TRINITY_DN1083_c0_g2_i3.p1  ORF type:complete len:451 (+),score=41.95 TRINITY_DN1083_c0_g2_i3:134-1486(+)
MSSTDFPNIPWKAKLKAITRGYQFLAQARQLDKFYDEILIETYLTRVAPSIVNPDALSSIRQRLPETAEIDLTKARLEMIKYDEWQHLHDCNQRLDKNLLEALSNFRNLTRISLSCFNVRKIADLKLLKLEKPYILNLVRFNEWRIPELYELLLQKPQNLQQIEIFVSLNAPNSIQLIKFLQENNSPVRLELAVSNAYFEHQFVTLENLCGQSDHLVSLFWRPRPIHPDALSHILSNNKSLTCLTLELFYEYQERIQQLQNNARVVEQLQGIKNLGFNVHSGLRSFVDLMEAGVNNIRRLSFRMGNFYGMVAKEALQGLLRMEKLEVLELRGGLAKKEYFEVVSQVKSLKELDLEVSLANNTWFDKSIAKMTQLTRLRIFVKSGDKIFKGIHNLTNLRSFDYSTDKLIGDLDVLHSLNKLTSLTLHFLKKNQKKIKKKKMFSQTYNCFLK